MRQFTLLLICMGFSFSLMAQAPRITIDKNNSGAKLLVDGKAFMVNGM